MEYSIEYWKEYYLLHSQTDIFKKHLNQSIEIIKKFLDHTKDINICVNLSAGKDSTVLVHLVNNICPNILVVSEKDDLDFPNELEYLNLLKEKYNLNLDIISPNISLWEAILKEDITNDIHSKGTNFSDEYFYGLLKSHFLNKSITGAFIGLRAEESKGRSMNYRKNGFIYFNKSWNNGEWICQPLALWSAKDIFAYLFLNDIPILDVYFKTKFIGSPEKIRKSWVLPSHQASRGQALWLKWYYPDIFNKLAIIKPELRNFI
jgi:3'-phosphoadenosine 5'-phosphosulfate sulfotransferase (PAPS reductase)/FAD synthetase